jgi:hypothetical protein
LLTRTWRFARLHLNGRYTMGPTSVRSEEGTAHGSTETDRWLAGIAVDRTFPLSAMLLIADVYAREPIDDNAAVEWHTSAGIRYQLNPRFALDAGIGRRLTGDPTWYVTFGTAYAFGLRALMSGN